VDLPRPEDPMTTERMRDTHSESTAHDGTEYLKSTAEYRSIIDGQRDILIATSIYGHKYRWGSAYTEDIAIPELQRWSDIAYLQWAYTKHFSKLNGLKTVVQYNIENKDTLAVIDHIVEEYRGNRKRNCASESEWSSRDLTFDMEADQAEALIATPNGYGVAWLLIQHKCQLGHKIVGTIKIFWDIGATRKGIRQPSLLICIEDVA
jgi:hypothetical protein